MENAISNTVNRYSKKECVYSQRYVILICALLFALISGRLINNLFFYIFAAVSLVVFVFSSIKHCVSFLMFLLPFASILKRDVDAISFFTILFFFLIAKMVMFHAKIDAVLFLYLLIFFTYNLVFSGMGQLTTIVTMIAGMLMLYYIRQENVDVNSVVITYSFGVCLSSILTLLKGSLPILNTFISDVTMKLGEGEYTSRFSGLAGNPNYYTLDIIMALSAIFVISYSTKNQKIYTFFTIVLSVFGMMSVSKSFLVTWVMLIIIWFILSVKQGGVKMVKFAFVLALGAFIIYFVADDYVHSFLMRFFKDSTGSINDITTGRYNIWINYIKAIFNDLKIMLFGNGLKTLCGVKGTHNTYLEALFNVGLVGSAVFLICLKQSMGKGIVKGVVWIPAIMLMVRMIAIGIFTHDNLWFYLLIIVLLSKLSNVQSYRKQILCTEKAEI